MFYLFYKVAVFDFVFCSVPVAFDFLFSTFLEKSHEKYRYTKKVIFSLLELSQRLVLLQQGVNLTLTVLF